MFTKDRKVQNEMRIPWRAAESPHGARCFLEEWESSRDSFQGGTSSSGSSGVQEEDEENQR